MELERTLFRVHERFLAVDGVKKSVNYCYKASIVLVLLTLPLFFYGNARFMNTSPCLKPYIDNNFILSKYNYKKKLNLIDPNARIEIPSPTPAANPANGMNQTDVANGTVVANGTALVNGTSGGDQVPATNVSTDANQTTTATNQTNQATGPDQTAPANPANSETDDTENNNANNTAAATNQTTAEPESDQTPSDSQPVEQIPSQDGNQTVALNQTEGETPTVVEQGNPVIGPDDLVVIRIADLSNPKLNLSNPDDLYLFFELSGTIQIVLMDPTIRESHNFTQHNITLDVSCYSSSFMSDLIMYLLNYENIMMNELIYTFKGFDRFVKNNMTGETWNFPDSQIRGLTEKEDIFSHISSRLLGIFKLLLGVFLVSNITAIYNKMTIICAPIFILAAYSLCSHPSQQQYDRMNLYRAFPWIGMYMYTLNNNGRRKDRYMIFAFFCMIAIFYCLYLAALVFWNLLLFSKSYPKGLDENFYGFLALIEFLVLLFLRTRTTLKYFPQMSMLLILMFLYYVQYTPYGFYNMCLFIINWCVLGLFAYFMLHFEIPGLSWNSSYHYTPSIDSPRMLYFPIFSLTWYHDIPQLWTMFFPVYGRSHFTNTELAMVNRNYPLLVSTLENASQGIRVQEEQDFGGDGNNANPAGGNNNIANNFPFGPQQEMVNLQGQNGNAPNEAAPGRLNVNSNSNLLAGANNPGDSQENSGPDYVLNISDDRPNNNNRLLNWRQNEENAQSQYRRIDDEA